MAGFYIVLLMIGMITVGIGIAIVLPLIVGFIIMPKDSEKRLKKAFVYWVGMLGVQIATLAITIILAIPIGLVIPFATWTTDDIGPLAFLLSIAFNVIPIILLTLFSIFVYKRISKSKTKKQTVIVIAIQSILMSFGIKMVGLATTATWIL